VIAVTYPITGGDYAAAGSASRGLKEQLKRLGVASEVMRRVMIAAYEAEMNVVIHARRGNLWASLNGGRVDLEVVDEGPGIGDVEAAMREGWSTAPAEARALGFGAGMGLPNIRRASDLFEIDSKPGRGTRVRSTIYLRRLEAAGSRPNSIAVRGELCQACLDCVAACPTRAIRLRGGKPVILEHLCIDCTACIAACRCGAFALRETEGPADWAPAAASAVASAVASAGAEVLALPLGALAGFPQAGPEEVMTALTAGGWRELRLTEEWETGVNEDTLSWARSGGVAASTKLPAAELSASAKLLTAVEGFTTRIARRQRLIIGGAKSDRVNADSPVDGLLRGVDGRWAGVAHTIGE